MIPSAVRVRSAGDGAEMYRCGCGGSAGPTGLVEDAELHLIGCPPADRTKTLRHGTTESLPAGRPRRARAIAASGRVAGCCDGRGGGTGFARADDGSLGMKRVAAVVSARAEDEGWAVRAGLSISSRTELLCAGRPAWKRYASSGRLREETRIRILRSKKIGRSARAAGPDGSPPARAVSRDSAG